MKLRKHSYSSNEASPSAPCYAHYAIKVSDRSARDDFRIVELPLDIQSSYSPDASRHNACETDSSMPILFARSFEREAQDTNRSALQIRQSLRLRDS